MSNRYYQTLLLMKNPGTGFLSSKEMVVSTLTAYLACSREETMKKFVKKEFAKLTNELSTVSEFRLQSSIEILGPHSRLQTVRFAAVASQIQRQYIGNPLAALSQLGSVTMPRQPFADYTPFNGI